jgi:hypothetical protein
VKTQTVGFAPILRHYFEKCAIQTIIDDNVDLNPRRDILSILGVPLYHYDYQYLFDSG